MAPQLDLPPWVAGCFSQQLLDRTDLDPSSTGNERVSQRSQLLLPGPPWRVHPSYSLLDPVLSPCKSLWAWGSVGGAGQTQVSWIIKHWLLWGASEALWALTAVKCDKKVNIPVPHLSRGQASLNLCLLELSWEAGRKQNRLEAAETPVTKQCPLTRSNWLLINTHS